MEHKPLWVAVVTIALGVVLFAAGVVLCFIPGPGTPLLFLGLALFGARWHWLARQLDRAEPPVRRWWHRTKQRLKRHHQHSY